jgi:hypothetical protein
MAIFNSYVKLPEGNSIKSYLDLYKINNLTCLGGNWRWEMFFFRHSINDQILAI